MVSGNGQAEPAIGIGDGGKMKKVITLLAVVFWVAFATAAHATPVLSTSISEPATMMLLGSGLMGLGIVSRRKIKK